MDCVAFLADYHEAAEAVDVLKHGATAGCNLCSFRKETTNIANSSMYAHCTNIHSKDASATRSCWKHTALREGGATDDEFSFLGMF